MKKKLKVKSGKWKASAGFTLIEMLVSIFCFSLIAVGMIGLISAMFTINRQQGGLLSDQDQARRLAFGIMSELRNCQTSSLGAYAIDTAGDQQLIFYSNVDSDQAIEKIRYFVQNGQLWKGVTKVSGSPLGYYPASEFITMVQNNLANGASPVFYYYDDSYTGTQGALAQPVNAVNINFVKISLSVYNKAGVSNVNSYTVTASAAIRNLKTNLGS